MTTEGFKNILASIKPDENGCLNWPKAKISTGYGQLKLKGETRLRFAHRFSYEIAFGEFDKSMFVCHKCDNPSCVNPDHLFLGSHRDNMRDCVNKGRFPCGERNILCKIPDAVIRKMRSMRATHSNKELSVMFKVDYSHVWEIMTYRIRRFS